MSELHSTETLKFLFDTVPGRVYELRLLLQREHHEGLGFNLSSDKVSLTFLNKSNNLIDRRLECKQTSGPARANIDVEVLPPCAITDEIAAGGMASRFLICPPSAIQIEISFNNKLVLCQRIELLPLSVAWNGTEGFKFRAALKNSCQYRRILLERHLQLTACSAVPLDLISNGPITEIDEIIAHFETCSDWREELTELLLPRIDQDYQKRMNKLRQQTVSLRRLGFIGSERGYERLFGMGEVFWLRESLYVDQLVLLDLDLIIIETTNNSGLGPEDAEWSWAFSSLNGSLPELGASLLNSAQLNGVPVHLWVTVTPDCAKFWRRCAASVGRVIAEGENENWSSLSRRPYKIPQATDLIACSVASLHERNYDQILIPVVTDAFQCLEFAALVKNSLQLNPLMTDFFNDFEISELDILFSTKPGRINGFYKKNRAGQRSLLQTAGIVLLSSQSVRSDRDLAMIAMDAIASGAIPVLFGTPRSDMPILHELYSVQNIDDFIGFWALYRVRWMRDRYWRYLSRFVMRNHCWNSKHRKTLLGQDPFPNGFDKPLISALLVTNLKGSLLDGLKSFRLQSWPNKELIIVVRSNFSTNDIPKLRKNEYILNVLQCHNIVENVNLAIKQSKGRYWTKMEDNNHYSSTFLEDTALSYKSTQADIICRQSAFFFLNGSEQTHVRPSAFSKCNIIISDCCLTYESLSADKTYVAEWLPLTNKNLYCLNWFREKSLSEARIFIADSTSIIPNLSSNENIPATSPSAPSLEFYTCAETKLLDLLEVEG
ncbi:hypothetical protein N9P17_07785 [Tateyamaria sp.]|nr:hypothetical protein [Tateyamaria sp.]